MSPCPRLHDHVSMSMSLYPCLYVHVSMYPCLHIHVPMFPEFRKRKTELTDNGNLRLFAVNGKRKRQTSVYLLQTDPDNESLFSLVGKC
jgi:hypothetical protein